jgi:alpha-glucosidase
MRNGRLKYRQIRDPLGRKYWPFFSGRDKARTPMQWDQLAESGFSRAVPWLPVNSDYKRRNVQTGRKEPSSLLNFYHSLITLRKSEYALSHGTWEPIVKGTGGILAYYRVYGEECILVVLNFTSGRKYLPLGTISLAGVLLSTHPQKASKGCSQRIEINPFEATIYRVLKRESEFPVGIRG